MNRRLFLPLILFALMLLALGSARSAAAQESRPAENGSVLGDSVTLTGFTADGQTTVTLNYIASASFNVDIYLSYNGVTQDVLLDFVTVTELDGSQDFSLGTTIDLVSSVNEINNDYYLLAVGPDGATRLFEGVYHYPADMVFVHGSNSTDSILISHSAGNIVVNFNATPYSNAAAGVTAVRARAHGSDDTVDASAQTLATIPTYQMGGDSDDILKGGNGNDVQVGGPGKDKLNGLGSTDKASFLDSPGGVVANIATGVVASDGWGSTDNLLGLQNLEGSEFDDLLSGNSAANFIHGHGGNDTINGLDGYDTLFGGIGVDTISGGNQDDSITGGDGDDWLDGGAGQDVIAGENGNDTIYGGAGADSLLGHGGNDIIFGGGANDSIYGGNEATVTNDDNLYGEGGNDTIYGGVGNDNIYGGPNPDSLYGGDGDDDLFAHNATPCSSDGAADSLNGGTHLSGDEGFYTFAQDTAAAIETATNCP